VLRYPSLAAAMADCNAVVVATGARDPTDVSPSGGSGACGPVQGRPGAVGAAGCAAEAVWRARASASPHPPPPPHTHTSPTPTPTPTPTRTPRNINPQPLGPLNVELNGNLNLIEAAKRLKAW
jgi:hypothetical protein